MNSLGSAAVLAVVHATIVVAATLVARACLSRGASDRRAGIGAVGLTCTLFLTVLALLPLPGILAVDGRVSTDSNPATGQPAAARFADLAPNDGTRSADQADPNADSQSSATISFSRVWFERVQRGLQQTSSPAAQVPRSWRRVMLGLLLLGSACHLARLIVALDAVRRLRRSSLPVTESRISATIDRLRERCGCRRRIEVRESSAVSTAAVCGWLRPMILLPSEWTHWSTDEVTAVLAHEVAHVRRGDFGQRLVALVCSAVHFYHPLVRAAGRRLAADQEFAADSLAREISGDQRVYARGLARLALRYHEALESKRAWPNVSVMPSSSDFLARRLEMLRGPNERQQDRSGRLKSVCATAVVVALALMTTLLRGAVAGEGPLAGESPIAEVTRRTDDSQDAATQGKPAETSEKLFGRATFDPTMLRANERGGFLIRVGDILRHPEMQPHVESLNESLVVLLRDLIGPMADDFDVREIEWMAGNLLFTVKGGEKPGVNGRFILGSSGMIIRTAKARNWQDEILGGIPGATLKTFEGKNYVQLPAMPALGPAPLLMRFPDDRTIVYGIGHVDDMKDPAAEARFRRAFLDDAPRPCPWASTWRAVDGGLLTLVSDNSAAGWSDLPASEKPGPAAITPLIEKTKYFALGLDWTEKENRTAMRARVTCEDATSVPALHLAGVTMLSYWPTLFLDTDDSLAKYHKRILQFFSTLDVQPSAAGADEHYVEATADVGWEKNEFFDVLTWAWSSP